MDKNLDGVLLVILDMWKTSTKYIDQAKKADN